MKSTIMDIYSEEIILTRFKIGQNYFQTLSIALSIILEWIA